MTPEREAQIEEIAQLAADYIESVDVEVRRLFPSDAPGRSDNRELAALRKAVAKLPSMDPALLVEIERAREAHREGRTISPDELDQQLLG